MANTDTIERLSRRRARFLIVCAVAYLGWQFPLFEAYHRLSAGPARFVDIFALSAGALFVAVMIWLLISGGRMPRDAGVGAALNDELVRDNRRRAFALGFWAMLFTAAAIMAVNLFVPIGGVDTAHVVVIVGAVVPLLRFAQLESRREG